MNRLTNDRLQFKGIFKVEHWRAGKKIGDIDIKNTVTTDGKNNIFNIMFGGLTQITAWFAGLIDNTGYSSNPVTDTMSSHSGWVEWQSYNEATRGQWTPGGASAGSITNPTAITYTINANGTLRGIFITSNSAKASTTGVLWSTVLFSTTVPVVAADQIKVTYTLSA